jgi:hypothetical protein
MRDFGLHVLGKSIVDATFAEIANPYAHAMSVVRCAHASELVIKARIAEEHPLLILERLPKPTDNNQSLGIDALLSDGRTIGYNDLPTALWAATGHTIEPEQDFQRFGRLRNTIMHLAVPDVDLAFETLNFTFTIIEPLVQRFWNTDILHFVSEYDPDCEEYLVERLADYKIRHARFNPTRHE